MGSGIVTSNGAHPLDEWRARLAWFGSEALSADLRSFLSGQPVRSADGELEISSLALPDGSGAVRITLRRSASPYVADLVVIPIKSTSDSQDRDPRSPIPAPDRWKTDSGDGVVWELFNCEVVTLKPREN
jgi:hypothetical protein